MSDPAKNYYLSVQGLEERIKIHEVDYNQLLERIQAESVDIMTIQSQTNPKQTYVIPTEKVNYFIIEKIEEDVETKKEDY
ncbi:MAG: hypothetical protein L0L95_12450 [Staphylococcus equorum]|nr:hypothetical protein [Lactococcus lactis]MDN6187092.1 hypothetical protein [Tetragenococcus halophilus]MDN6751054.1 hypothetical protein [Staphylococcus equorum]